MTVEVQVPVNLTGAQRDAVEALAAVLDDDPRAGAVRVDAQDRRKRDGDS